MVDDSRSCAHITHMRSIARCEGEEPRRVSGSPGTESSGTLDSWRQVALRDQASLPDYDQQALREICVRFVMIYAICCGAMSTVWSYRLAVARSYQRHSASHNARQASWPNPISNEWHTVLTVHVGRISYSQDQVWVENRHESILVAHRLDMVFHNCPSKLLIW